MYSHYWKQNQLFIISLFTVVLLVTFSLPVLETVSLTELAYDGGSEESYDCPNQNTWRAVKFVFSDFSLSGSYKLLQARIFRSNRETPNDQLELHILTSDGTGDLPGTTPVIFTTTHGGWNDIDLSGQNIIVSGDFWIAYKWLGPNNSPCIAYEYSSTGRSFKGSPGSWTQFDDTYMIRAVVDPLPEPSAPVGGVVTPVNKTEVLIPLLALVGLFTVISAVLAVRKRSIS